MRREGLGGVWITKKWGEWREKKEKKREEKRREEKRREEKRREEEEFAIEDKEGTENTEIEKRKRSLGE